DCRYIALAALVESRLDNAWRRYPLHAVNPVNAARMVTVYLFDALPSQIALPPVLIERPADTVGKLAPIESGKLLVIHTLLLAAVHWPNAVQLFDFSRANEYPVIGAALKLLQLAAVHIVPKRCRRHVEQSRYFCKLHQFR